MSEAKDYSAVVDELSGHLTDQVEEFKDALTEIMEDEEVIEDLAQIFTISQNNTFTGTMEILQRHDMVHADLIECIEQNLFGGLDD